MNVEKRCGDVAIAYASVVVCWAGCSLPHSRRRCSVEFDGMVASQAVHVKALCGMEATFWLSSCVRLAVTHHDLFLLQLSPV